MLNQVTIRNFKSLRDVTVDLERFTVFVGPNASGKSSILQAMDLLCRLIRATDLNPDNELAQYLSRGAKQQVELIGVSGGQAYRYRVRSTLAVAAPYHLSHLNGGGWSVSSDLSATDAKPWTPESAESCPLPDSVVLRLEASRLVQPGPDPVKPDSTVMSPDGTGLHSALASMALNDPDSWQALQTALRRIIPSIRRLRHTKAVNIFQPPSLLFDTVGADSLSAAQISEGTLLVLGLLAALHAHGRPNLILLDDLDRGLHPKAQNELITLLRGLLETNPDLQIIATTHSPYMLDCMETNEVRMTFLNDDGSTLCAPLSSHPDFPKWKDEMTPGEMWSLFGEKWLVEQGVPA